MNAHQRSREAVASAFYLRIAQVAGKNAKNKQLAVELDDIPAPDETDFPVAEFIAGLDLPKDASLAEHKYAWATMWQKFEQAWRDM